eukprot:7391733-Prymnesium_polylepis.1
MPTSACRMPCRSISRRTAVSPIDTTSSSSSHAAHSRIISPTVYLPSTLCAASRSAADPQWRGTYTSSAWMPAWCDASEETLRAGLSEYAAASPPWSTLSSFLIPAACI